MRFICNSRVYRHSIRTNKLNEDDEINFSHAKARRLPAEVLYDAVYAGLSLKPDERRPLVYDDGDQSLESYVQALTDDIACGGAVIRRSTMPAVTRSTSGAGASTSWYTVLFESASVKVSSNMRCIRSMLRSLSTKVSRSRVGRLYAISVDANITFV